MPQLDGKVALVTGANKGIGKEIVRQLSGLGATVFLGARNASQGMAMAAELKAAGADVRWVPLDVSDPSSVQSAADRIAAQTERLDILVNNAGVFMDGRTPMTQISVRELRDTYEVNVFGVVTVTNSCLSLLRRSSDARIVNVSARLGSLSLATTHGHHVAKTRLLAYNSSKTALNALTIMYANELREAGILVNAAYPGFVATDMNGHRGTLSVREGAAVPVHLATLPATGPTGTFWGPSEQSGQFEMLEW